jgi:hypothetical protein
MLQHITLLGAYVYTKQWSVKKMKAPYDVPLPTFIHVIYMKDKFYYFNKINVISIMTVVKGKEVNWANNLFKQLQLFLMRWTTSQIKMMGIVKVNHKKMFVIQH